jgi:hypothetical protein
LECQWDVDVGLGAPPRGASRAEAIDKVERAKAALDGGTIDADAGDALRALADAVGSL